MEHAFKVNKGAVFTNEIESNHGRIETRQCSILPDKDYLLEEYLQAWKQVATLTKTVSFQNRFTEKSVNLLWN
jgi:hypothetical protein